MSGYETYGGWAPSTEAELAEAAAEPYVTPTGVVPDWVLALRAAVASPEVCTCGRFPVRRACATCQQTKRKAMSETHSADKDAGRALAERLLDDAMIEEVVEAIRVAQAAGHVEYRRRVGYHGRVTIAKTVLDAICERLGVPTSIDLLMDQHTHVTSPERSDS